MQQLFQDPSNHYYIPKRSILYKSTSPIQEWAPKYTLANEFTGNDIKTLVDYWLENDKNNFRRIPSYKRPDYSLSITSFETCLFEDTLVPTKENGHPQTTIPRKLVEYFERDYWDDNKSQLKISRHLIIWRYLNNFEPIPEGLEISHCDHDHRILNLVAESHELNESRKACHLFGWYEKKDSNGVILCPHRSYHACS